MSCGLHTGYADCMTWLGSVMRVAYGVCGLHDMVVHCMRVAWCSMRVAWSLCGSHGHCMRVAWRGSFSNVGQICMHIAVTDRGSYPGCHAGRIWPYAGRMTWQKVLVGGYLGPLVPKLGFAYLKGTRGSRILSVSSCLLFPNCRLSLMCWEQ